MSNKSSLDLRGDYYETAKREIPNICKLIVTEKEKAEPFKFTKFPIVIPINEIYKVRGDTGKTYIDLDAIDLNLKAIRRDGNWPKEFLREENFLLRIATSLLGMMDVKGFQERLETGNFYFYMDSPKQSPWIEATKAIDELMGRIPRYWLVTPINKAFDGSYVNKEQLLSSKHLPKE